MPEGAQKGPARTLAIGEAGFASDDVHRVPSLFEHQTRCFDTQMLDRLGRRLPRLHPERAAKLARTEVGRRSKLFDGQRRLQVLLGVVEGILYAVGLRLQFEQGGVLRLPAGAPVIQDEFLRHRPRHGRAQILLDHREREIDARRHAGRSPDPAIDDEDPVFLDALCSARVWMRR